VRLLYQHPEWSTGTRTILRETWIRFNDLASSQLSLCCEVALLTSLVIELFHLSGTDNYLTTYSQKENNAPLCRHFIVNPSSSFGDLAYVLGGDQDPICGLR
jgi:hypothetical protein